MLYDPKWKNPAKVDEVGQLLLRAADFMEEHGWCQRMYTDRVGQVCVLGAIIVMTEAGEDADLKANAQMRLNAFLGRAGHVWNDYVCKSKEEAVTALRAAAYHK